MDCVDGYNPMGGRIGLCLLGVSRVYGEVERENKYIRGTYVLSFDVVDRHCMGCVVLCCCVV